MNAHLDIAVIIPCKNEATHLPGCLEALLRQKALSGFVSEIWVVDNGSTDDTDMVLEHFRDRIQSISLPDVPISTLRNTGAAATSAPWLAFIDADVEVGKSWAAGIKQAIMEFQAKGLDPLQVLTGATYSIPSPASWVEKVWFSHLHGREKKNTTYLNGGNLIVHRTLFEKTGGFDPDFPTGEDVKFCHDAVLHGGIILPHEAIVAIHHGYPKTVSQFFKRERWHGLGMGQYLFHPWQGKDLTMALTFLLLAALFALGLVTSVPIILLLPAFALLYVLPLIALALWRTRPRFNFTLPLTWLFFVYGWARVLSVLDIIRLGKWKKNGRPAR